MHPFDIFTLHQLESTALSLVFKDINVQQLTALPFLVGTREPVLKTRSCTVNTNLFSQNAQSSMQRDLGSVWTGGNVRRRAVAHDLPMAGGTPPSTRLQRDRCILSQEQPARACVVEPNMHCTVQEPTLKAQHQRSHCARNTLGINNFHKLNCRHMSMWFVWTFTTRGRQRCCVVAAAIPCRTQSPRVHSTWTFGSNNLFSRTLLVRFKDCCYQ
mmetsp:Transcript_105843/g.210367  ORF Transcript_105843/g.210367 Transcript_105843/m.210367 type:complete len:214 (+) Transcript_105843:167-808(+)